MYQYLYPLFFGFFFHIGHNRVLSRVPCATQHIPVIYFIHANAKSLQSCPTLCDPIDGSPLGSSVPGIVPGKNTGVGCHFLLQCMKVKSEREVAQSCLTLSDPIDCSPPGLSIHGVFQARVLEWGAIAFSNFIYSRIYMSVTISQLIPPFLIPW